jgi:hypothetical protein
LIQQAGNNRQLGCTNTIILGALPLASHHFENAMKISSGPPGCNFREGKGYIRPYTLMPDNIDLNNYTVNEKKVLVFFYKS